MSARGRVGFAVVSSLALGVGALHCGSFGATGEPAPADAGASDGSTTPDAPGEASAVPFCASLVPAPVLCRDFDQGDVLAGWDGRDTFDAGSLTADEAFSRSPPRSLLARFTAPPPDCAYERVTSTIPTNGRRQVRLAFAVRLGDADGGAFDGSNLALLDLRTAAGDETKVYIDTGPTGSRIHEQYTAGGLGHDPTFGFAILSRAQWVDFELAIDLTTGAFRTKILGETKPGVLEHPVLADDIEVSIGMACAVAGSPPIEIRYDNVVFDLQ